jgi:AcrR family transcriptional regulator
MTKSKVKPSRGEYRSQTLIAQLEKLFLEEGFRDLTVDEIAARLSCSKRSLYQIAPSKLEIFLRILDQFLDRIRRMGNRAVLEHDDPAARLAAYMEPGYIETKRASRRFVEDIQASKAALQLLEAHQRERMNTLRDIVDDGIRRDQFRKVNSLLVAEAYLAAIAKIDDPEFLRRAGLGFSEAFAELYQLIAYGVFRSAPEAKKPAKQRRPE